MTEQKLIPKDRADECPQCGSFDVEGGSVEIHENGANQRCWCLACRAEWLACHNFAGVMMISDGDNARKYVIRSRVSGGVTGTREAYLKSADGSICEFPDKGAAQREATRLNREMNHGARSATFTYSVEPA